jgi:ABC-2 type transport system ATP-binding protein
MSSTLIDAQHLHRYYADTHAVNDVCIELHQGDILGLLGPNGAGKTSCMQMLCGSLAPSSGQITIKQFDLLEQPTQAKRHIGYLPDKPPLYPELTVDEYLDYVARLRKVSKASIAAQRNKSKQQCGLSQHGKKLIGHLSKGYQQRLGIAQAIIHQPDIIILDEPTVGLDPIQIREIRELIGELGALHGIILSTHILPEVQAVCNRVQMIHQGRSLFNKSMQQLRQSNRVLLQLEQAIDATELQKIPGVDSAQPLNQQQYLLEGAQLQDTLAEISRYCVEKNWGLLQIQLQENTLEQIFIGLSSGDATTQDEDAA